MENDLNQLRKTGSEARKREEAKKFRDAPAPAALTAKATETSYWYTSRFAHAVTLLAASTPPIIFGSIISFYVFASFTHYAPYLAVSIPIISLSTAIALWPFARVHAKKTYQQEMRWIQSLPFTVNNYWNVLGKKGNYFDISITYFKEREPEENFLADVVKGLGEKNLSCDSSYSIDFRYDVAYFGGSKRLGRFEFVRLMHKLCNNVLIPLHNQYKFTVEVDSHYHVSSRSN